ncbi:MAG: carbon starvation protein A [Bacteroidales bacterium]|nr:carbon starvation protein A [Bacteroidales bacterium]MBQ5530071.1 carbon starvation protein A [Bacteroidales bacterium]
MISFILALLALVAGYFFYGRFVERVFGADDRPTPAVSKADGVDFMVLPSWKIFMIQFLNIAGTGPIFGAIMGAKFGPAAYLWIVFGCIFAGAVHDYLSGMLSVRHGGANLPDLIGTYLGKTTKTVMLIFSVLMLMMVGAVFVFSPAKILGGMWEPAFAVAHLGKYGFWIAVVFIYYIIATMLPIDKIIGRIYPLFAFALIFMAISLMVVLFVKFPDIPEVWEGLKDTPGGALTKNPIFPCLFISIACGAISGFHATQSPLMARCMDHEKKGRPIFYGAMITEGAVALIWATVASYFFYGKPEPAFQLIPGGAEAIGDAPSIVNLVCNEWLGVFGGILALLGVVAAPITSGDTALRSARLIIADFLNLEQRSIRKRLYICLPLFAAVFALLMWQMNDASGFEKLWGWFGWSNQTLSVFTLWTLTVYLAIEKKPYVITLVPALFMTWVCTTFFVYSPNSLGLNLYLSYGIGFAAVLVAIIWFSVWHRRRFQRA